MSKGANAVLALSRSMYGKRLKKENYDQLLSLKNSNEIASYLKSKTEYQTAFESFTFSEYTPEILCDVVEEYHLHRLQKLFKFEEIIGEEFYKYFLTKSEIDQILDCTMHIIAGNKDKYLLEVKNSLDRNLGINLFSLGKADTLEEVSESLRHSPYKKVFDSCFNKSDFTYLDFENAFSVYLCDFEEKLLKSAFKKSEREKVKRAMCLIKDVSFIEKSLRVLYYYGDSPAIRSGLVPYKMTLFSKGERKNLMESKSAGDFLLNLKSTPYKSLSGTNKTNLTFSANKFLFDYFKHELIFSTEPGLVLYSFVYLSEVERNNLLKIIKGKKFSFSNLDILNELQI